LERHSFHVDDFQHSLSFDADRVELGQGFIGISAQQHSFGMQIRHFRHDGMHLSICNLGGFKIR
jgi:hypothetical protein